MQHNHLGEEAEPHVNVDAAVFHDTLLVLAEAVRTLNFHAFLGTTDVSCLAERSWDSGATFFNYINAVETTGITGQIRFKVKLAAALKVESRTLKPGPTNYFTLLCDAVCDEVNI